MKRTMDIYRQAVRFMLQHTLHKYLLKADRTAPAEPASESLKT